MAWRLNKVSITINYRYQRVYWSYVFLNKSSSTSELPSEAPITLHDLRCITMLSFEARARPDLCRSAIAIAGFMPATCVRFTLHLLRTRAFIIRHLRGCDSCCWGRDTWDPTRDKGTPRRSTTDTEIGIWTASLKRVARRKKTGRNRCYPTTSTSPDPLRWDDKKRESLRLRGIPTETRT